MKTEGFELGNAVALADLAQKMRRYFLTVQMAYAFLFNATIICAYWLAVISLAFLFDLDELLLFWVAALLILIPVVLLAAYVSGVASPSATSQVWRTRGKYFGLLFAVPFVITYSMRLPPYMYSVAWYPALAVSLLLVHVFIERESYRRGEVLAMPFLASSVLTLLTSPLIFIVIGKSPLAAWTLALSFMLTSYTFAAFIALYKARRGLVG
ncbi:MAG: hypothetical protein QW189_06200 [Thermofilaceae archaeon]